jgi:hypothetical protein
MDAAQTATDLYRTMANKAKNKEMHISLLQRAMYICCHILLFIVDYYL